MSDPIDALQTKVKAVVAKTEFGELLRGIEVDENDDPDQLFVRIYLKFKNIEKISPKQMVSLQVAIEDGLAEIGKSNASVRFTEAA
jgi:hypothetical protein